MWRRQLAVELRGLPTIAIIGGGFAGAAVAYHLHRSLPDRARIVIAEPRSEIGRGLAYSTEDGAHRINVPADRMSLLPDDTKHFDRWLRDTNALVGDPQALTGDGDAYPARRLFGDYVIAQLRPIAHAFVHIPERARRITQAGSRYRIETETATVDADIVVLGMCHPAPGHPALLPDAVVRHPMFIGDPWQPRTLETIALDARVLIVGTGLTMADIVASLERRGHRGRILAMSRRGLRSRSHAHLTSDPFGDFISEPSRTANELVRRIRRAIKAAQGEGLSWHPVLDQVRLQGSAIWRALRHDERRRLLRHLRPFWDTHRFRIAPQVAAVLDRRIAEGRLSIRAASLVSISGPAPFRVTTRRRGIKETGTDDFDAIVLATGPAHHNLFADDPLLHELEQSGLIRADAYGLGIEVDLTGRVVTGEGDHDIYVAGPLARGTFGELIAVPDIANHALRIAADIRRRIDELESTRGPGRERSISAAIG